MPPLSYSYQYPGTYHKRIGSITHIQKETEAALTFVSCSYHILSGHLRRPSVKSHCFCPLFDYSFLLRSKFALSLVVVECCLILWICASFCSREQGCNDICCTSRWAAMLFLRWKSLINQLSTNELFRITIQYKLPYAKLQNFSEMKKYLGKELRTGNVSQCAMRC